MSVLLAVLAQAATLAPPPASGSYTNEEERYFAQEAKQPDVPQWTGIELSADRRWRRVDAFGMPQGDWAPGLPPGARMQADGRMVLELAPGRVTTLRRGERWRCWVSLRRTQDKPDGGADWSFAANLAIHDQGGRVLATDPGAEGAVLRLRQVVWPPPSRNKPSLVLYVHRPDEPERAVSYSWADPQARLIGINLRWMQGSCSREEMQ